MYDLRVTVVGMEVFAAAIHSQETEYPVDSRIDIINAEIEPVVLPDHLSDLLLQLTDALGLVYGAIDLRRTPDDRYVFLEINPSGQFRYIEVATGLPITAALAAALMANERKLVESTTT
jgi:glutathione synthase/RimK-type ligase-like ATP-grasp enzyme